MDFQIFIPKDNGMRDMKNISVQELVLLRRGKIRTHTQKVDHSLLKHLKDFRGENVNIRDVDAEFCNEFARYLTITAGLKSSSIRTYFHKLHAVLQEAVEYGYISHNPMPPINRLIPRSVNREKDYLTAAEVGRLMRADCPHTATKLAFLFSCHTGLRLSDIETLRWDNINFSFKPYMLTKIQVKTNTEVRIPLSKQAVDILRREKQKAIDGSQKVFLLPSRTTIYSDLIQWAKNARIKKHLTFHVSRVTFVTLSLSAGISIYVISKLCGHRNMETTQIYARMIDSAYVDAITRLENLFKDKKA